MSGAFYWAIESMAGRTGNERLRDRLVEISREGLHWTDLEEFWPQERAELLHLLHTTAQEARRALPDTAGRDAVIAALASMAVLR